MKATIWIKRCWPVIVSVMLVVSAYPHSNAMAANGASSPMFVLAPIRVGGYMRYGLTTYFPVTVQPPITSTYQSIEATFIARTVGYIWQPWFLQLNAKLGMRVARSMAERSSNSLNMTGRASVSFLPRSRFPFRAFYEQQVTSPNEDLFGIGQLVTRYGAEQSWLTRKGGLHMLTYDATIVDNQDALINQGVGKTFSDVATFLSFFRGPGSDLQLRANYRRESQQGGLNKFWGRNISITHRFQPNREFDMNNLASYDETINKKQSAYSSSQFSQVSSSFSWNPYQKQWAMYGGVSGHQIKTNGVSSNSASASLGGRAWITHTEKWNSQFSASAFQVKDEPAIFTQILTTRYRDSTNIGPFRYSWNTGSAARNRMSEGINSQNYNASIGHSITRGGSLLGLRTTVGLNESLGFTYSTENRDVAPNIRHSGSFSLGRSTSMSSTTMTFSGGVSHRWGATSRKGTSQLYNFQFSHRQTLTRYSNIRAHVTAQAARQSTVLDGSEGFTGGLIGNVNYSHVRLFHVPNLRMSSDLSFASTSVSPRTGLPQDVQLNSWQARLDYFFGRITTSMLIRITGEEGNYYGSLSFTLTRRFG